MAIQDNSLYDDMNGLTVSAGEQIRTAHDCFENEEWNEAEKALKVARNDARKLLLDIGFALTEIDQNKGKQI